MEEVHLQSTEIGRKTIRDEQNTGDTLIAATFIGAIGTATDRTSVDDIEEATTTTRSITRCQGGLVSLFQRLCTHSIFYPACNTDWDANSHQKYSGGAKEKTILNGVAYEAR
jgi:hypothetical protein